MRAIVCNRCRKVITLPKEIDETITFKTETIGDGRINEYHLCDGCYGDFILWLDKKEDEKE